MAIVHMNTFLEGDRKNVGQKNVIELNGKKYDALTGALLGESRIKATSASRAAIPHRGQAIDGFVKHNSSQPAATIIKPQTNVPQKPVATPRNSQPVTSGKNMDIRRVASPKSTIKAHQPERPKTLMRHVVKKPQVAMKPSMKTATPSEVMAAPKSTIARPLEKKLSASSVNPFRLARSRQVAKSHHIRRFEQDRQPIPHVAAAVATTRPDQSAVRPVRQDFTGPQVIIQQKSAVPQRTAGPAAAAAKQQSAGDIFEAALAHATSHEQKTPLHAKHRSSRRRRFVNVMAGIGAFLLIGGFTAYMNMTNIEMRVASMRAGFHAQMPNYQPTGYALDGGIESSEGRVAMNFRSGNSQYTVTQEASDWNSTTLLDQTSAQRGEPSQTIQNKGRTIYIYDESNATWVNGGVRYQVSGNAPLDPDELVSLATSM
jgi:hypothetical protein